MYNRDGNLCIVKSVEKLMDWAKSPRAEIFKILHSVDMLVFKNTKWPTCVYMIKTYNTNSGDIFLIKMRWTKTEELIWYCVYMLFFPKGMGHMHKDLGVVWLNITPRTHYIHFLEGSLLYMPWGLVWKVKGRVRVYIHDLKLQG